MDRKCAVVTGASRGIGLATALRLARADHDVVIAARSATDLQEARRLIEAAGVACEPVAADVGRPEGAKSIIAAAQRRFGRVDVLVNNAGCAPLAPLEQFPDDEFARCVAVNMAAVFHTTRAVWPLMRARQGGVIVNVSSLASVDPFPGFAVYGASKAWVNLFTKAVADEGRPLGIRVFAVAPGAVETQLLRERFRDFPRDQTLDPEHVADVILSVCDEKMARCTGQTIFVRK